MKKSMNLQRKIILQKILAIIGLSLILFGLIIHSLIPIEIGNSNVSSVPNNGVRNVEDVEDRYIIHVKPNLINIEGEFSMQVFITLST